MKRFLGLLALSLCAVTIARAQLITLETWQSMRIPNHRVKLTLEETGQLTRETENQGEAAKAKTFQVTGDQLLTLKKRLAAIDWKSIRKDKTLGLDGSKVRVLYDGMDVSLWAPDNSTQKRGLEELQKVIADLNRFAGLNAAGMAVPDPLLNPPPAPQEPTR